MIADVHEPAGDGRNRLIHWHTMGAGERVSPLLVPQMRPIALNLKRTGRWPSGLFSNLCPWPSAKDGMGRAVGAWP